MLIPHLMFAHMLADYTLQSNWLVARKSNSWTGLVIHGGIVGFISMIAVAPYLDAVWLPLVVLMVLHTLQDQGKGSVFHTCGLLAETLYRASGC